MSLALKVITYSCHLFNGTLPGVLPQRPTVTERLERIIYPLNEKGSHLVGLSEIWHEADKQ